MKKNASKYKVRASVLIQSEPIRLLELWRILTNAGGANGDDANPNADDANPDAGDAIPSDGDASPSDGDDDASPSDGDATVASDGDDANALPWSSAVWHPAAPSPQRPD